MRGIHRSPVNPRTKASDKELWCFIWSAPWKNALLSKQSWGWWFVTPSCSLWRHCNASSLCPFYIYIQSQRFKRNFPLARQKTGEKHFNEAVNYKKHSVCLGNKTYYRQGFRCFETTRLRHMFQVFSFYWLRSWQVRVFRDYCWPLVKFVIYLGFLCFQIPCQMHGVLCILSDNGLSSPN